MIAAQRIQPADLWKRPIAEADRKLAYGPDSLEFGELRLPKTKGSLSTSRGAVRVAWSKDPDGNVLSVTNA
jgi:hypothetical protein